MKRTSESTFFVRAFWDDEAKVYVSESDTKGLHIAAETREEFESVILEHAGEFVTENHFP
jgi:Domain of unknown function (DUF1902)